MRGTDRILRLSDAARVRRIDGSYATLRAMLSVTLAAAGLVAAMPGATSGYANARGALV